MGKLSTFYIVDLIVLVFFSTMQKSNVRWPFSVRKPAPSHNSLHQKLINGILYYLAYTRKFHFFS